MYLIALPEGPSLNDCLFRSPEVTPLIFEIFHCFQRCEVALTSGVGKAFLQISIDSKEQDLLRFLWFENASF